ncbi:hypothetical protein NHJ6243_006298 [Beauveria neobassiana]
MGMQLTELAEQLVTIRHNLDPKHGDIPDPDELEATSLALSQRTDRLLIGILPSIRTEIDELLLELSECLQRILADPGRPGGHALTVDTMRDVWRKMIEIEAKFNSYLTEWNTFWAEYNRFETELDGASEQLVRGRSDLQSSVV